MRLHPIAALVACTPQVASTQPSTSEAPTLCDVESALADEQAALSLRAPSVCNELHDLGEQSLLEAGLVPQETDFGNVLAPDALAHRAELEGPRRLLRYDDVTISVASDGVADLELAVLTAQALSILRSDHPGAADLLAELRQPPTDPTLDCCGWRNHVEELVLSLDATPRDVGAAVTILGPGEPEGAETIFANTAVISLHRETVLGGDPRRGSRFVYGSADARENQLRYFVDGAVFTLTHEAAHLTIDHRNSVSEVAHRVWGGRFYVNDAYVAAEEVIANHSACAPLAAGLSEEMLQANASITAALQGQLGVEDRLEELRLLSNSSSPRLLLDLPEPCQE